jgi:Tat protein secretion system quality control protein TatD with DNase activity
LFDQHPTIFEDNRVELRNLLVGPRCAGLGEVGLDYRHNQLDLQRARQRRGLEGMLRLRAGNQAVVLHCRGSGAMADCLGIVSQHLRPGTAPVQIHCFLGDSQDVARWTEAFPGCLFSFGPKSLTLTGTTREHHQIAARGLNLNQILLETDSPYLQRPNVTPLEELRRVSEWLGGVMNVSASTVLAAARVNAIQAFGIPPGVR